MINIAKILSIGLVLFFGTQFSSQAQIKKPFPDTTGAWIIHHSVSNFPFDPTYSGFRYYINGDTMINSLNYNKLYIGGVNVSDSATAGSSVYIKGFFRLDSNKVFFKNHSMPFEEFGFNDTSEVLLYDFNMNIGDSIIIRRDDYDTCYLQLYAIDSIITATDTLRRWNFDAVDCYMAYGLTWVEGIGSEVGFFPYYFYFESSNTLACFYDNGQFYDKNGDDLGATSGCETVGINENHKENAFTVFPNPATNKLYFTLRQNNISTLTIIVRDITGRTLIDLKDQRLMNKNVIDLGSFNAGTYTIAFKNNELDETHIFVKVE